MDINRYVWFGLDFLVARKTNSIPQFYCVGDRWKCDSIVPETATATAADDDDDGEMRAFFGEIFFGAGCKRLRSFRKSAKKKKRKKTKTN